MNKYRNMDKYSNNILIIDPAIIIVKEEHLQLIIREIIVSIDKVNT
jgi:hypothetical protein